MPSKVYSCAVSGVDAYPVEIEVDLLSGLPRFTVVGLPDAAVQESKERVRSAIVNSGGKFPQMRKIVNLAPADVRKCGPSFDLPIAVGLLMESEQVPVVNNMRAAFLGELALDGSLRSVPGTLSAAMLAEECGFGAIFVPAVNAKEALLGTALDVFPVNHLKDLIAHLRGEIFLIPAQPTSPPLNGATFVPKSCFLRGRKEAIRAMTIAASGGHHVLLSGSPGCGKTMTARQLPRLLPPLAEKEKVELTKIYSAAGLLKPEQPLIIDRPFRSVHHTASVISLIGGGHPVRPGEITLAHRGVLFLDELTEFPRSILESLRQPLESRTITISRSSGAFSFPSRFMLVGAMNPCPCGYYQDPQKKCICTSRERLKYQKKLSGPFLDRMDLFLKMQPISYQELHDDNWIPADTCLGMIRGARETQQKRYKSSMLLNSDLLVRNLAKHCPLTTNAENLLRKTMEDNHLSARAYARILKVSRTVADMLGDEIIQEHHLLEALQFRLGAD